MASRWTKNFCLPESMANNVSQAARMEKSARLRANGKRADVIRRRLSQIDMEPDGTKPNCRKDPQPGFTIARSVEPV